MEVTDIPLIGRQFTWYRPNGTANDRVLISRWWLETWQGCSQYVLNRDVSDHCVILIKNNSFDHSGSSMVGFKVEDFMPCSRKLG